YLVDIICELLKKYGTTRAVVNAGGDVAVFGEDAALNEIALQHPHNDTQAIGTVAIVNVSICGSSIHTRRWADHHHIINPKTAESPVQIQAVWVTARATMLADGLSTALFFVSPRQLQAHFNF